jgi:hypothetical protein
MTNSYCNRVARVSPFMMQRNSGIYENVKHTRLRKTIKSEGTFSKGGLEKFRKKLIVFGLDISECLLYTMSAHYNI